MIDLAKHIVEKAKSNPELLEILRKLAELDEAKHLVGLMGGEIDVESVYGEGSNFFFTITLKRGEGAKRKVVATELKGLRVMVVDDNESARRVMDSYLTDFSFETILVSSGEEGVSQFEASLADR